MKYKIYEGGTVKEELTKLLDDGYVPCSLKEVVVARNKREIPNKGYDTGTVYFWKVGDIREATVKELRGIIKGDVKGRVLFARDDDSNGLNGVSLYNFGHFLVRVKESKKKVKQ